MNFLLKFTLFTLLLTIASCTVENDSDNNDNDDMPPLPDNEFFKFVINLNKKLGLEETFSQVGKKLTKLVREGQKPTAKEFEKDFAKVKQSPTLWNVVDFLKKWTWPGMVQTSVKLIKSVTETQDFLLKTLRKKCDKYIGKDALVHPWNVMKNANDAQLSFFVFAYALIFSLFVLKMMTWWNFAVYLALGFLVYHLGGLNLVLRCLLTLTAFVWWVFDIVVMYPLHAAVVIVITYVANRFIG